MRVESEERTVTIGRRPWYADHNVDGRIIIAAVETMIFLAGAAARSNPEVDVRVMEEGRFAKFLEFPSSASEIDVRISCHGQAGDCLQTRLFSRVPIKKMTRIREHGTLTFPLANKTLPLPPDIDPAPPGPAKTAIVSDEIYSRMVPFGPSYQSLKGTLHLTENGAWGRLQAPALPWTDAVQDIIGSPFPFDGALHAACVLGLQYVDYAPFPVGFDKRIIYRPTLAGAEYITKAVLISCTPEELLFNLWIFDYDGKVYEKATNVRMRDVKKAITRS